MLDLMSNDSRYNFYGEEIRDGKIKCKKMIKLWGNLFEDGWLMQVEENALILSQIAKQIKIENWTFNR